VPSPRFLYFDLGNVLVTFDVRVMCRQMGEVAGIEPSRVMEAAIGQGLLTRYETGQITTEQFHQEFCRATGTRPDRAALSFAASDIFHLRTSIVPVVAHLRQAGCRLGILSNTCEIHWDYCRKRFRLLNDLFAVHALSFRIGAVKPEGAIFRAATALAGVEPGEVFFTDDCPGHVAGARAAGFDAVQFTSTPELVAELRARGLRFNY
jgi:HAD superfamily hydrolase (TIGR01509 family)